MMITMVEEDYEPRRARGESRSSAPPERAVGESRSRTKNQKNLLPQRNGDSLFFSTMACDAAFALSSAYVPILNDEEFDWVRKESATGSTSYRANKTILSEPVASGTDNADFLSTSSSSSLRISDADDRRRQ